MDESALLQRWTALIEACVDERHRSSPEIAAVGRKLIARWAQPHRRYHDLVHLQAVLDATDELASHADDANLVEIAGWFHDAVYDGVPGQDERASAALADETLTALGLPEGAVVEVERLVLLTVEHSPGDDDRNGQVLCDADLAILAASPADYLDYTKRIRDEYAHVPDQLFVVGRAQVLRRLLDLDPLFHTPHAQSEWQAPARANLSAELNRLAASA